MVLRATGGWAPQHWAFAMLYRAYSASIVVVLLVLVASQTMAVLHYWGDLVTVTMNACLVFTYCMTTFKLTNFLYMRQMTDRLLQELNEGLQDFGSYHQLEKAAVYRECSRWSRLIMLVYVGLSGMVSVCWLTLPALRAGACQTVECKVKEGLPALVWYPFPFSETPVYEVVYVMLSLGMFCGCINTTSLDSFFFALIIFTSGELRVLNQMVQSMCDCATNDKVSSDEQMHARLVECVRFHVHINRCVDELSSLLGPILLGQFLTDIIAISATAFVATITETDSSWLFTYGIYLSSITEQLFFYCWFGHDILTESERLQLSAYSSSWTAGLSKTFRQDLGILLCRTQRPMKLTASNIYTISRETFLLLMNACFSYYAVLRQLNSD